MTNKYPTLTALTGRSEEDLLRLLRRTDEKSCRAALHMAIFTADTNKASSLDPELRALWRDIARVTNGR